MNLRRKLLNDVTVPLPQKNHETQDANITSMKKEKGNKNSLSEL